MKKATGAIILILLLYSLTYSLEKPTHLAINEEIATRNINGFSLDTYLINQIGFSKGIKEEFLKDSDKKTVLQWLGYGGIKEDEPLWRSFRHFHNPLETWDRAGLKGSTLGRSSIIWAQSRDQSYGNYSWQDVRGYFYYALTSKDKTTREKYFAETFRGLGQLMHLIEDASVPLHTRDDMHIIFSYEGWVEELRNIEPGTFNTWLGNAKSYDKSILNLPQNPLAPIPIARIIDTDKYTGTNPDITTNAIGIAEYSNANFLSEDTRFADFPYPNWDSVEKTNYPITDPREPSNPVLRQYYKKVRDGETGYRLATVGFLKDYVLTYFPTSAKILRAFEKPALDANVYRDYASLLIPRAVGYSAGLLNYFFRGEMDMVTDDVKGSGYVIVNNTDEDMSGTFELWYDNNKNERVKVSGASWTLNIGKKSSGNNKSTNITFSSPTDAKDSKYMLIFRGKLGNEEDAVAGKIVELEKDYLFLVNLKNQTMALEIKLNNNQYQLIPASKNINITRFSMPSTLLTVQSHPNQREHMVALPRTSLNQDGTVKHSTYNPTIGGYGGQYEDTWWEWLIWYIWKYPQVVRGFPNAYIPKDFKEGSPYVWDSQFIYGEDVSVGTWPRIQWRFASYIHGRRPFSIVNNKLVAKNINIRKNDAYTYSSSDYTGPFHIQYKDESGRWIRGIDLPDAGGDHIYKRVVPNYNCTTEYVSDGWIDTCGMLADSVTQSQKSTPISYLVVLDQEKTIYAKTDISDISQYSLEKDGELKSVVTTTYKYYNNWCNRTYAIKKDWSATYKDIGVNSTYSTKSKLVIGDTILEEFEIKRTDRSNSSEDMRYFGGKSLETKISDSNPNCYLYQGSSKVESINKAISISGDTTTVTINGKAYQSLVRNSSSESNGKTFTKIMDYDHVEGDKHYILFYEYQDNNSQSSAKYMSNRGVYGTGEDARIINSDQGLAELIQRFYQSHDQKQTRITKTGSVLAYSINGVLNKIDLGINFMDTYTLISGWDNLNISSDGYSYTVDSTYTQNRTTEGKRLTGISSQINDANMVYTYIMERYDNGKWVFDKRIVGIINIADPGLPVGYRQEFEITEANAAEFLTDIYKDYNYKDLAAIGVHIDRK